MRHHVRIFLLSGQNVDILCAKFGLEGRSYVARDNDSPIDGESTILAIFPQDRVAGYLLIDPQRKMAEEQTVSLKEPKA